MSDWLDKLAKEIVNTGEEPPTGYKSREQIQKQLGYTGPSGAVRWIKRAVEIGKLKKVLVRRPTKSGGITIVPYYGPK